MFAYLDCMQSTRYMIVPYTMKSHEVALWHRDSAYVVRYMIVCMCVCLVVSLTECYKCRTLRGAYNAEMWDEGVLGSC